MTDNTKALASLVANGYKPEAAAKRLKIHADTAHEIRYSRQYQRELRNALHTKALHTAAKAIEYLNGVISNPDETPSAKRNASLAILNYSESVAKPVKGDSSTATPIEEMSAGELRQFIDRGAGRLDAIANGAKIIDADGQSDRKAAKATSTH